MKKTIIGLILPVIFLAACHNDHNNVPIPPGQLSIVGKWNVDSVTTYFYDSSGLLQMGVHVYPAGAPDYPYHFQFNNDHSFVESLHLSTDSDYTAAAGTYTFASDSAFTLIYPTASAGRDVEPCSIISLTGTSFVFSKKLATVFNGTDPGYIKYVYQLTKL
ncbi:MAG TPA: hypothetical protein VG676_12770 [Chitinophagaceae bacterium]|nr:hypothetical protein [Chitinophagaceae bacterium]